ANEGPSPALDDLWSWDGKQWIQVAGHTGVAMLAHNLFADRAGAVFARGAPAGSTSRWDGTEWHTVVTDTTSYREMAAGAYDTRRRRYVLFGGHLMAGFPAETREFDGRSWTVVATGGPAPRLGAAMAFDEERQRCVLFGGIAAAGERLGDTWTWDGKAWTRQ